MLTQKMIYKILIQQIENCQLHQTLKRAFSPFILIHPRCKAKEIFDMIKKERTKNA